MKQYSSDFLATFQTLPNSCVYAIINDSSKTCLIGHANDLQARIGVILASNRIGENVRLEILEVLDDLEYKLLFCQQYINKYRADGFEVLNKKDYINYYVRLQYSKDFHKVNVVLYNKRRDKKIVGIFSNMNDARSFVDEFYKQPGGFPVVSTNKATKEYMEKERKVKKSGRVQD
jgi:hypothetical protein